MSTRTPTVGTKAPRFTVVIPTFRRDTFLQQAITSVLEQSLKDFELIVVDDAHSPATRATVEAFKDPRITYVENDHQSGGAGTRNAGIERSSGEWVAFLDDDDFWLPHKLERVDQLIASAAANVGFVYSGHEKYDFDTQEVINTIRPRLRGRVQDDVLYRNDIGGLSVAVARRDLLTKVGGLDEHFTSLQDMDLYVRLAGECAFDFVAETMVRVRQASGPRISTDPGKRLEGVTLFAEKFETMIQRSPRLRHRSAARIFIVALAAGNADAMSKNAVWTFLGLVFDPRNAGYLVTSLLRAFRNRNRRPASA